MPVSASGLPCSWASVGPRSAAISITSPAASFSALRRNPSSRLHEAKASCAVAIASRSEEHTSELQSLMRISYAVFCLKKKKKKENNKSHCKVPRQQTLQITKNNKFNAHNTNRLA